MSRASSFFKLKQQIIQTKKKTYGFSINLLECNSKVLTFCLHFASDFHNFQLCTHKKKLPKLIYFYSLLIKYKFGFFSVWENDQNHTIDMAGCYLLGLDYIAKNLLKYYVQHGVKKNCALLGIAQKK